MNLFWNSTSFSPFAIIYGYNLEVITLKRYLPVVLWSGLIFFLSSLPSTPAPETWWNFLLKKGAHVTEYAILYWLAYRATNERQDSSVIARSLESAEGRRGNLKLHEIATPRQSGFAMTIKKDPDWIRPLLFTIFYAISDEIHQSFVPGRHGKWYDVAIFDIIGMLFAMQMLRRRYLRNSS